jgi:predicted AlkP superfamily phosphohydrolase/phosphomutase
MNEKAQAPRCLVIGLDGASLDLIRKFAADGYLPNLAGLMDRGVYGPLRSTFPPMSPSAWTSFMTGKNPGKHGIFDFTQRLTGTYRTHVTSRSQEATLWGLLSSYNRRVAVFNVPQTYPVEPVNGIMVTGLGTPQGRSFTYPVELGHDLLRKGYKIDADVHFQLGRESEFLRRSIDVVKQDLALILPLLRSMEWDFGMVVLRMTDEIPHFFWKYMDRTHPAYEDRPEYADAILQCYREADRCVGDLLANAGKATIIVMSDHGFGPLYRDVYLNEWLRRTGFLTLRSQLGVSARTWHLMQKIGFTRTNIGRSLSRLGLSKLRGALRSALGEKAALIPNDQRQHLSDLVDWSRTRAYSMGYIGQVFVNLAGREPHGIVQSGAEYEKVLLELTEVLLSMPDPDDGQPIVDRVLRRSEIYAGPHLYDAADLYLVMRDFSYITRESYDWSASGKYVVPPPTLECAAHRLDGVLILAGENVSGHGIELTGACIIDLAPTILHLLALPVPSDMDGRVLAEWLDSGAAHRPSAIDFQEVDYQAGKPANLSAEDEADLLDRLKKLGYVE